jgi:hypothetical protein
MKLKKWFCAGLLVMGVTVFASDLDFSGYVRNYTGIFLSEDPDFSILQNSFDLTMQYSANNVAFLANPYVNIDEEVVSDLDFRELYVDLFFTNFDFRVGKQQVIWGKSDGVFITDVVSPKNLQEFLLPDFTEIRIGVNAAKVDYYIGSSTIEVIWVPEFVSNIMPDSDSIWNTSGIDFSGSYDDIDTSLENSEFFARYSMMTSLCDFELVGAYMWDDEPVITSFGPTMTFEHERLTMGGGSASSSLGNFVLRAEGAYYNGKDFYKDDYSLHTSDYMHYAVGLDTKVAGFSVSSQFIQKIILDYEDSLQDDQFTNTATFSINKSFLRDTLTTKIFSYIELGDTNALIRPSVTYDFGEGVITTLGANIFVGDSGTYGQFDDNDMGYVKVTYNF